MRFLWNEQPPNPTNGINYVDRFAVPHMTRLRAEVQYFLNKTKSSLSYVKYSRVQLLQKLTAMLPNVRQLDSVSSLGDMHLGPFSVTEDRKTLTGLLFPSQRQSLAQMIMH